MSKRKCPGIALAIAVATQSALVSDTANAQMYVAGPGYYNGLRFQTNVTPSGICVVPQAVVNVTSLG